MTVYNDLMSKIADQGLLFNVESERMTTESGREVPNKRALINAKSGRIMSVVSDSYKVVTNEEIFSSFCTALSNTPEIDCTGATVDVKQTPTGSRAMVNFAFPAHEIKVNGDTSGTILQFSTLNSFDGSTRYLTKAGGLRMKCMNGQIVGDIVGAYSSTHTRNLDVDAGAETIVKMFSDFNKAKEYWGAMMQTPVSADNATAVFMRFLNIKQSAYDSKEIAIMNNKRMAHCWNLWGRYSKEMGHNAYALYNVLTDYVSHPQRDAKNPTVALLKQQQRLNKTLHASPLFRQCKDTAITELRAAA